MFESIVGIDLHKRVSQVSVVGPKGPERAARSFLHDPDSLRQFKCFLQGQPGPHLAVVEATGNARWMLRFLRQDCGYEEVRLVNPASVGTRDGVAKTDRRDALKLACKARTEDLTYCYEPTEEEFAVRTLSRARVRLVRHRTAMVNALRALLAQENLDARVRRLLGPKGRAELETLLTRLPACSLAVARCYLGVIDALAPQIRELEKGLAKELRREHSPVAERARRLFGEVPSCGELTATGVAAELGDPTRFNHRSEVASYAGLAPTTRASADHCYHGPLSHRGNAFLRWWVGQMAVRLLTHDNNAKEWAERHHHLHANRRRGALARRLVVGMWSALKRDVPFDLRKALGLDPVAGGGSVGVRRSTRGTVKV